MSSSPEPPTFDVQLLLHALDVGGRLLLHEVQDLDGVGHPEEDVLQVRQQVRDAETGQGGRVLAGETAGVTLLPPSLWPRAFGVKKAKKSSPRDEFGELLLTEPAPCLGKPFAHINSVALWDGKGGTWRFFWGTPQRGPSSAAGSARG